MTGVWVNTSEAPEITSVNDLFDPKYKGKVTVLDEMRDTIPLVMRGMGIEKEEATKEDWLAAIDKVDQAVDSGQIRRITGQEYTEDLTSGNVVASIGWSGDAYLIGRDDVEWRRPEEGCNLWFDMVVIPVGAPNTAAALEFINFAYEPKVQADIAEFVNYVTPVAGVREILTKRDPALGKNQLIFPDDDIRQRLRPLLRAARQPGGRGRGERGVGGGDLRLTTRRRRTSPADFACGDPPAPRPLRAARAGRDLARPVLRRADVLHGRARAALGHRSRRGSTSPGSGRTSRTRSRGAGSRSAAPSSTPARRPCWRC